MKTNVLPRARSDFRAAAEYALALELGIDIPPNQMAAMAHKGFNAVQVR